MGGICMGQPRSRRSQPLPSAPCRSLPLSFALLCLVAVCVLGLSGAVLAAESHSGSALTHSLAAHRAVGSGRGLLVDEDDEEPGEGEGEKERESSTASEQQHEEGGSMAGSGTVRNGKLLVDVSAAQTAQGGDSAGLSSESEPATTAVAAAAAAAAAAAGPAGGKKKKAGLVNALLSSFSMILVTEIGDETFIIAALMAMRHSRSIVLAGALSALAIMTVLSTGLGLILPNLISRKATNSAAAVLYTFFGLRLLYIAWKSDPKESVQKELEEVEEKLEGDENGKSVRRGRSVRRFFARFCTPVFLEAFILTFLAEWGDRSQIATIALASHKNAVGVTVGATLGHVVCTSLAVLGGRLLALRISQRTVAMVGGFLFLIFAVHSYISPVEE